MAQVRFQIGDVAGARHALFLTPLALDDDERREVRTVLGPSADGFDFRVTSRGELGWQEHARGWIGPLTPAEPRRCVRTCTAVRDRGDGRAARARDAARTPDRARRRGRPRHPGARRV
ncbi:MAG: hypothetical protein GY856_15475 [bacterium]|nr:hypothetical protein [bacterium]